MARISIEALYTGEGTGGKYGSGGLMGAVMTEIFTHGVPHGYDARTWAEMLLIKHVLLAAEQMKQEGDSISGMTDSEPFSLRTEGWISGTAPTPSPRCGSPHNLVTKTGFTCTSFRISAKSR